MASLDQHFDEIKKLALEQGRTHEEISKTLNKLSKYNLTCGCSGRSVRKFCAEKGISQRSKVNSTDFQLSWRGILVCCNFFVCKDFTEKKSL